MSEIKLNKILGFSGILKENVVTYGCRSFSVEDYENLYNILKKLNIKAYTLGAGVVKIEELEEMIKIIKSSSSLSKD